MLDYLHRKMTRRGLEVGTMYAPETKVRQARSDCATGRVTVEMIASDNINSMQDHNVDW